MRNRLDQLDVETSNHWLKHLSSKFNHVRLSTMAIFASFHTTLCVSVFYLRWRHTVVGEVVQTAGGNSFGVGGDMSVIYMSLSLPVNQGMKYRPPRSCILWSASNGLRSVNQRLDGLPSFSMLC